MDDSTFRSVCIAYGHSPFVANSNQPPFIRFADTSRTAAHYGTHIDKRGVIHRPSSHNMALEHFRPSPFQLAEHLVTPCRSGGEDSRPAPQVASRWHPTHTAMTKASYSNITVCAPLQSSYGFLPASKWPDFMPSLIWTATTDRGSRVVTWEGARLDRDVSQTSQKGNPSWVPFPIWCTRHGDRTKRSSAFGPIPRSLATIPLLPRLTTLICSSHLLGSCSSKTRNKRTIP